MNPTKRYTSSILAIGLDFFKNSYIREVKHKNTGNKDLTLSNTYSSIEPAKGFLDRFMAYIQPSSLFTHLNTEPNSPDPIFSNS